MKEKETKERKALLAIAGFWRSVHRNMADAHSAAARISATICPLYEGADRYAYLKAVRFAALITSTNGAMERAKAKYHTDDLYQIYRKIGKEARYDTDL